jgi:DNA-binding MarR family transcriptional regulator
MNATIEAIEPRVKRTAIDLMPRLGGAFYRARLELPPIMRDAFERGALAARHVPVINLLAFDGEMGVSAIADRLGVGLPAASQLVGELAREQWVERREDEGDRRRTLVALACDRRRSVEAYCRKRAAPLLRAVERLPSRERRVFLEGLTFLVEEMARDAPEKNRK